MSQSDREVVLKALVERSYQQAPRGKKFTLASGNQSSVIIDGSLSLRNRGVNMALARLLKEVIPSDLEFNVVAGPACGADPVSVAIFCHLRDNSSLEWCSIRKESKKHGFDKGLITGKIEKGDRVLLTEDVLTAGTNSRRAISALLDMGCVIVGGVVVVNRGEFGGRSNVEKLIRPAPLWWLFTLAEIREFRKKILRDSNQSA